MKVFKFLSFYLIDFKLYIECSVYIELLIKVWPVAGYRIHKFPHLKEKKMIFSLAIVKKYSSCRIEVIFYDIFTVKYQKVSISFILTKQNTSILFLALQILLRHILIILYMNYNFWDVFAWLIQDKENNHKKNWSKANHNFSCLFL